MTNEEFNVVIEDNDTINVNTVTDNVNVLFGDGNYNIQPITSYEELSDLPQINSVTLIGNKNSSELYLQDKMDALTNFEIEELLDNFS